MMTAFADTFTRGFANVDEPSVAVCLRPGTELAFDSEPEYDRPYTRWLPRARPGKLASKVARFRLINLEQKDTHHDALEFPDGRVVLLTSICPGQRATVLRLPPDLQKATVAKKDARSLDVGDLAPPIGARTDPACFRI